MSFVISHPALVLDEFAYPARSPQPVCGELLILAKSVIRHTQDPTLRAAHCYYLLGGRCQLSRLDRLIEYTRTWPAVRRRPESAS